ncbi:hypothetical protein B0O80DRAFT_493210 [Mortierella sp. GBAus27b]|nr:hypothetical protein BGX31_010096 [Mortierella sp. GBA43]KAI8362197.1 hypothetical protein B0O80DRAFT_493210 [Mortierella sp. GBAus27b]
MTILRSTSERVQALVSRQRLTPLATFAGPHGHRHQESMSRILLSSIQNCSITRAYTSRAGQQGSTPTPTAKPKPSGLDPDKIKGPGGLTMTQIGKLVRESHSKDTDHKAKTGQPPKGSKN